VWNCDIESDVNTGHGSAQFVSMIDVNLIQPPWENKKVGHCRAPLQGA